jgi:Domain of unknown function (DUF4304)
MADSAHQAFRQLLRDHVAPALRELGFVGSGTAYRLQIPGAIALLGFQRSRYDDRDVVAFTANLTAGPEAAWEEARQRYAFLPERPAANTRYPGGLWHGRLGMQMPAAQDLWWELAPDSDLAALGGEIIAAVREHGIPALRAHAGG